MANTANTKEKTFLADLVNPEVMADMIADKVEKKIRVIPYAQLDTTLQGRAGDTITVPRWVWDSKAQIVGEGEEIPIRNLGTETAEYSIHKIGIGGNLSDESLLSGHGDPIGALTAGIANSIRQRIDDDAMTELLKATTVYDATGNTATGTEINYINTVYAIDKFEEEDNAEKVMFVHPNQVTSLRLDPNFIDRTKYGNQVMIDGEIGMIGNARIVPTKRVAGCGGYFYSPVLKMAMDPETEDGLPALTYYIKRDTNVETERIARRRLTEITADQMFVVALTNDSRVVLLKTTGAPLKTEQMEELEYTYPGTTAVVNTGGVKSRITNGASDTEKNLVLSGRAPKIDTVSATALGLASGTTHNAVVLVEVPGAPLNAVPTEVYLAKDGAAETAMTAGDIRFVNGVPYLILIIGGTDSNGVFTPSLSEFSLKYGANGTAVTFAVNADGLAVEA